MSSTRKELTKEKIQQAAYKCVARFGFEKTTLDDIAKEVGLNKASLYYYYKNKEEIFLEVTTTATRRFVETLQLSTLEKKGTAAALVAHYLYERSVYFLQLIEQVHISEETLQQVEPLFYELIQDVAAKEVDFLSKILERAIVSREIRPVAPAQLAANLIALSDALKEKAKAGAADRRNTAAISADIRSNLNFMLDILFGGLKVD